MFIFRALWWVFLFLLAAICGGLFFLTGSATVVEEFDVMPFEGEAESFAEPAPMELPTIAEIAVEDGRFGVLVSALKQTGLDEVLNDPNARFTVFAPTDDAFGALPEGTLAQLTDEELTDILLYHAVPGTFFAEDVISFETVTTIQGGDIVISVEDGVFVNQAEVIIVDIVASNGVIHVIDAVLLPTVDVDADDATEEAVEEESEDDTDNE